MQKGIKIIYMQNNKFSFIVIFLIILYTFNFKWVLSQPTINGIGLVIFDGGLNNYWVPTDTINIYSDSTYNKLLAYVIKDSIESFKFFYLNISAKIDKSFIEYDNDKYGVLIDNILVPDKIKIIIGKKGNKNQYGWIHFNCKLFSIVTWRTLFLSHPLFILKETVNFHFYDSFEGKELNIKVDQINNDLDYILYPIEINRSWLKVRLVTPSDYCNENIKNVKEYIVWIKYVDNKGYPMVWFYPRGC